MDETEVEFVRWLKATQAGPHRETRLGIGDDMAILDVGGATILLTTDMLLDGVHFRTSEHSFEAIGRKAIACSLSDCAAMAVRPIAALVSVAVPRNAPNGAVRRLVEGMRGAAAQFECDIVGGDTTCWNQPLAIDVCMVAGTYPGVEPVRRSGAQRGDVLAVTGGLGGSLEGHHMTFTPRVAEARRMAEELGPDLHALMDISDGLALDLSRMCEASGTGARVDEARLESVVSEAARRCSARDGRSAPDHALHDGEDFELLAAIAPGASAHLAGLGLAVIGSVTESGLMLVGRDGASRPLEPRGYDHFHE